MLVSKVRFWFVLPSLMGTGMAWKAFGVGPVTLVRQCGFVWGRQQRHTYFSLVLPHCIHVELMVWR